ncbi:MAG: protein kinase [Planctomycetota bacterium]
MSQELPGIPLEVLERIGAGGMGEVYRARDAQGRALALKLLLRGQGEGDPTVRRRRFEREAAALERVQHPNVVGVVARGDSPRGPWLAMPFLEGEPLEAKLPLPIPAALELALQLGAGLRAAHAVGVLHRDLKPDNVVVCRDGRYVLVDFGLTKDVEGQGQSGTLTRTGMLQGTPGYWAPEQAAGEGRRVSVETDVYGYGATLYAALTGVPPADGQTLLELLVATQERPPRAPRELRPEVPAWLEAFVLRCLEKSPSARYPSMEAALEALHAGIAGQAPTWRCSGCGEPPRGGVTPLVCVCGKQYHPLCLRTQPCATPGCGGGGRASGRASPGPGLVVDPEPEPQERAPSPLRRLFANPERVQTAVFLSAIALGTLPGLALLHAHWGASAGGAELREAATFLAVGAVAGGVLAVIALAALEWLGDLVRQRDDPKIRLTCLTILGSALLASALVAGESWQAGRSPTQVLVVGVLSFVGTFVLVGLFMVSVVGQALVALVEALRALLRGRRR